MKTRGLTSLLLLAVLAIMPAGGCATAPKADKRADFKLRAESTREWFETSVAGLEAQIDESAAYIVFPDIAQWGIILTGGTFGRGALYRANDEQIGWAAMNNFSLGLQAGVQGFRMVLVLETEETLQKFMEGHLNGTANGVAVAGQAGGTARAPFTDGVATYQGASSGLMAGVNFGLDYIRYTKLGEEDDA